jgi:hypothetical protein
MTRFSRQRPTSTTLEANPGSSGYFSTKEIRPIVKNNRWMELCRLASGEQDPQKLLALIKAINDRLDAKEETVPDKAPSRPHRLISD